MFSKIRFQNLDGAIGLPLRGERPRQHGPDSGSALVAELDGAFRLADRLLRRPQAQVGIGEERVSAPRIRLEFQGLLEMRNCIRGLVFP